MQTATTRQNNFGALRLLFASLVIASHSPEMLDGDRSRELLTMAFGTISFGELAVDGFFLVSGYLITKSMVQSPSLWVFLMNRVARIVPAYLVVFWLCVLVLAPFVSAEPVYTQSTLVENLLRTLSLSEPMVPGAFAGLHFPRLNGPLWTIQWEFLCYLGIAAVGVLGFLRSSRQYFVLAAAVVFITAYALQIYIGFGGFLTTSVLRFGSLFLTGAAYYSFRDTIAYRPFGAAVAALALFAAMFVPALAEAGVAIFGGYLIFWFAFRVPMVGFSRFDNQLDISYGLYLYAFPVGSVIIMLWPTIDPWVLGFVTLPIASAFGVASWLLVERPVLDGVKKWRTRQPRPYPIDAEQA